MPEMPNPPAQPPTPEAPRPSAEALALYLDVSKMVDEHRFTADVAYELFDRHLAGLREEIEQLKVTFPGRCRGCEALLEDNKASADECDTLRAKLERSADEVDGAVGKITELEMQLAARRRQVERLRGLTRVRCDHGRTKEQGCHRCRPDGEAWK